MVCRNCDAILHCVIEADGGGLHCFLSKYGINVALLCYQCKPLGNHSTQWRLSGRQIIKPNARSRCVPVTHLESEFCLLGRVATALAKCGDWVMCPGFGGKGARRTAFRTTPNVLACDFAPKPHAHGPVTAPLSPSANTSGQNTSPHPNPLPKGEGARQSYHHRAVGH
jgi:hypothetical protein